MSPPHHAATPFPHRTTQSKMVTLTAALALLDLVVLSLAAALAWRFRDALESLLVGSVSVDQVVDETVLFLVATMTALFLAGGYATRNVESGIEIYSIVARCTLIIFGGGGALLYLSDQRFARGYLVLLYVFWTVGLLLNRWAIRKRIAHWRRQGRLPVPTLIVGTPTSVCETMRALDRVPYLGMSVVGCCPIPDDSPHDSYPVPVLGELSDLRAVAQHARIEAVIVAGSAPTASDLREIAWRLHGTAIDLIVQPSMLDVAGPRVHFRVDAGFPRVHIAEPQTRRAVSIGKRALDIAGALMALIVLSPLMLVVAALIKREDGGAVLFSQPRVGLRNELFPCYKFRSMTERADVIEAQLRQQSGHAGTRWKLEQDPRVTKIGSFIRRYSIDELPQLLNVLNGAMSLVGPRPQQQWEVDTYTHQQTRRLLVKPGMTGLWQVSGRNNLPQDESDRLDLYYVENWTMLGDLIILARTVKAVLAKDGAY